jgi:hypothetical protein
LEEAQNGVYDLEEIVSTAHCQREGPTEAGHEIIERIPVEGDSSHIDRFSKALSRAQVRFQIVSGVGSRGQSSGHVAVVVSSLLSARISLWRAGFIESPESKYVLIDSQTGWKVRLLEERPRTSDGSGV